jgi:hypothetical protein
MNNVKAKDIVIIILFMSILLLMVSVNKKLQKSNYYSQEYINADWCSDEINILRSQVSDIWYKYEFDE